MYLLTVFYESNQYVVVWGESPIDNKFVASVRGTKMNTYDLGDRFMIVGIEQSYKEGWLAGDRIAPLCEGADEGQVYLRTREMQTCCGLRIE